MKSISTINLAITENMECSIIKVHAPAIDIKSGCVALTRCITTLCFASSSVNVWLTFQAKNNARSAPARVPLHFFAIEEYIFFLLLASGNIETHPGPNRQYQCTVCCKMSTM